MAGYLLLSDPSLLPPPLPSTTSCIYRKSSSGTNKEQTENNKYSDNTSVNQTTVPHVASVSPPTRSNLLKVNCHLYEDFYNLHKTFSFKKSPITKESK